MTDQPISKDDQDAIARKISDVINSLCALQKLAVGSLDEPFDAGTLAQIVADLTQHNIRILDACSNKMRGANHGSFESVFP